MSDQSMAGRDLYLKHTDTSGKSTVQQHRVWDADKFFFARQGDALKANAEVKGDAPRLAAVELSTREHYINSRSGK